MIFGNHGAGQNTDGGANKVQGSFTELIYYTSMQNWGNNVIFHRDELKDY